MTASGLVFFSLVYSRAERKRTERGRNVMRISSEKISTDQAEFQKKIDEKYSSFEIINCLRNMELLNHGVAGYEPVYTRTDLTDLLHEQFGFRTDYEITDPMEMKKILRILKK